MTMREKRDAYLDQGPWHPDVSAYVHALSVELVRQPEYIHEAICGKTHDGKTCSDPKGHTERLRFHAPKLFSPEA